MTDIGPLGLARVNILKIAIEVFETAELAESWLCEPNITLSNRTPLEVIEAGQELDAVETVLRRIQHGVYS